LIAAELFFVFLASWPCCSVEVVPLRFPTALLPIFVAVDGGTGLAAGKLEMIKAESGRASGSILLVATCEAYYMVN